VFVLFVTFESRQPPNRSRLEKPKVRGPQLAFKNFVYIGIQQKVAYLPNDCHQDFQHGNKDCLFKQGLTRNGHGLLMVATETCQKDQRTNLSAEFWATLLSCLLDDRQL
jgi:hypothetical protein